MTPYFGIFSGPNIGQYNEQIKFFYITKSSPRARHGRAIGCSGVLTDYFLASTKFPLMNLWIMLDT